MRWPMIVQNFSNSRPTVYRRFGIALLERFLLDKNTRGSLSFLGNYEVVTFLAA